MVQTVIQNLGMCFPTLPRTRPAHARAREREGLLKFEPLTQEEMAQVLGITKSAQQKLERRLFAKLKSEFEKRGVDSRCLEELLTAIG
jgi:hypothetical protein